MKNFEINIILNPAKDGITMMPKKPVKNGKIMIIATNGDYRFADKEEVAEIVDEIGDNLEMDYLYKDIYGVFFDKSKILSADGVKYLVGSVIVMNVANDDVAELDDEEVSFVKGAFISRLVELRAYEEAFNAYEIG